MNISRYLLSSIIYVYYCDLHQFCHGSVICTLFQFEQLLLHVVFTHWDHKTNRESNLF